MQRGGSSAEQGEAQAANGSLPSPPARSFPTTFTSASSAPQAAGGGGCSSTTCPSICVPTVQASLPPPAPAAALGSPSFSGTRRARVLYDYDAAGSSELSLLADEVGGVPWPGGVAWGCGYGRSRQVPFCPQVIAVRSVPGMDSDWLMGERGNQKGKVPITYLELLN